MAFSPDGSILATSTHLGYLTVWDVETGEPMHSNKTFEGFPNLTFSLDGQTLAGSSGIRNDDPDKLFDFGNLSMLMDMTTGDVSRYGPVMAVFGGGRLVLSYHNGGAILVDPETMLGSNIQYLGANDSYFCALAMHPAGETLAIGTTDDSIIIWDLQDSTKVTTLLGSGNWDVNRLEFSLDGRMLASVSYNNRVKVWDTENWRILHFYNKPATNMSFSPDSRLLAVTIGESWLTELVDTISWEVVSVLDFGKEYQSHQHGLTAVAISERYVASAGDDDIIRLWEYDTPDIPTSVKATSWGAVKREIQE